MKNLFFIPFAFDANKASGLNIGKENVLEIYLKNLCVALLSAKKSNADTDVALVCNMKIPEFYEKLLLDHGVLIYIEPFETFVFPDDTPWCLAFYKLCALEKMIAKGDYDYYIYTDADVFVVFLFHRYTRLWGQDHRRDF